MFSTSTKTKSLLILFVIILISVFCTRKIIDLKFNYDFESYFPKNDADYDFLIHHRQTFENDTDFLIIALDNKNSIYDSLFLSKVKNLSDSIKSSPYVRKTISPLQLKTPIVSSAGIFEIPIIHTTDYSKLKSDSVRLAKYRHLSAGLISANSSALLLIVFNKENIKKVEGDSLISFIDQQILLNNFNRAEVAGKIKASKIYIEKMKAELEIFILASTLLISLFLYLAYKSWWGVLFPLITVVLSILWTLAVMAILGKDLDLLTSLLPPILFVVAMSDMTHLLSKYLEELRNGVEKNMALKNALKDVGITTFITAVTTAIGFVTLINSTIQPIRDFGFYTAIGVFISFFLAFTFLPAILFLLPKPKVALVKNEVIFWHKFLQRMLIWICKNPLMIISSTVTLMLLSALLATNISVDAKLLDDISDDDPLKKSVAYLEENFGGIRPFELSLNSKDSSSLLNYETLERLNRLESTIKSLYGVDDLLSVNNFIIYAFQAQNGGLDDFYRFPTAQEFQGLIPLLVKFSKTKEFRLYSSKNFSNFRISGRLKDVGSLKISQINAELETYMNKTFSQTNIQYKLTGSSLLIDKNNSYLAQSLIEDLVVGIISIAVIIGLLFRNFRMMILALIPNIIPLLLIGGVMGLFDIHLKASTSIIFSIAFGIAVDDSIHFLSRFKMELAKKKSVLYALKRTYISTGKAMIVTSLILVSGFATLLLSSFESTFYTGLLIGLTLVFAIVADLILLPALLIIFYKRKQ